MKNINVSGFKWQKRAEMFKGNNGNCTLNPVTGTAYSYRWYILASKFKGLQVVNVYNYSNQTVKHKIKVLDVFRQLGIECVTVEAPRGLQDLDSSLNYHIAELGRAIVADKYARIKRSCSINYHIASLETLTKLGYKHSKKSIVQATKSAENERAARLARARRVSANKRAKAQQRVDRDLSLVLGGA